jgi:BASS family bile acid:Na+ symporter
MSPHPWSPFAGHAVVRGLERAADAFPLWVLSACGLALVEPTWFTWFRGGAIVAALALIMLSMGLTLSLEDFRRVALRPQAVVAGLVAQFGVMPTAGFTVATLAGLPTDLAVGLMLVSCCPGGTASNVVAAIARADVPLSVVMTACSTATAVVATPLLSAMLVGRLVEVDAWHLLLSTLEVVILPVTAGVTINRFRPDVVRAVAPVAPLASALLIALVCGSIIGQNAGAVRASGLRLVAAVAAMHAIGFAVGWLFAAVLRLGARTARTISIETGMQNSGLGVVLAQRHFAAEPLAAVPCAISSVVHSLLGSLLAAGWRIRPVTDRPDLGDAGPPEAGHWGDGSGRE